MVLTNALWGSVWEARFGPDGTNIIGIEVSDCPEVWEAQTGQLLTTANSSTGGTVRAVTLDGRRVVAHSDDDYLQIRDGQTGQLVRSLFWCDPIGFSAQFSPNGKTLVTSFHQHTWNDDKVTTQLWNAISGQSLAGP